MPREIILTDKAPKPLGPYSQAVRAGDFLFLAGQIALDPQTGALAGPDIKTQTRRVLENIRGILQAANADPRNVVEARVFITRTEDFAAMNEVYREFFPEGPPARTTVGIQLLKPEWLVEIAVVAYLGR